MAKITIKILRSMRGAFLPYRTENANIPGGIVDIKDLSYRERDLDRRHMKDDFLNLSSDFRKSTKKAKEIFQVAE